MITENAARFHQSITETILGPDGDYTGAPPSTYGLPRASNIGSGCLRQVQYSAYQYPASEGATESGRLATNEGQLLQALAEHWVLHIPGVEMWKGPSMQAPFWTATPDLPIIWDGVKHLVEIKWMGYYRFSDLLKDKDVRSAHPPIYWQCIAQLENCPEAESVILLAFPFDYGAVKGTRGRAKKGEPPKPLPDIKYVEEITRSSTALAVLKGIANQVSANHPNDLLLPRGYRPGDGTEPARDWQCNYCSWRGLCVEDGE